MTRVTHASASLAIELKTGVQNVVVLPQPAFNQTIFYGANPEAQAEIDQLLFNVSPVVLGVTRLGDLTLREWAERFAALVEQGKRNREKEKSHG